MEPTYDSFSSPKQCVSRRQFLRFASGSSMAALLAACGVAPQATAPTSPPAPTEQPLAATSAPAVTSAPTTTASEQRTIVDAEGVQTLVSTPPRRIATLYDSIDLDACLGLGVDMVAYCTDPNDSRAKLPWKKIPANVKQIAVGDGPNLEQLIAQKPDFVLSAWGDPATNARVREYCPIVYISLDDWRVMTRMAGRALFRDAAAEALIGQTEARIAESRARLSGVGRVNVVSVFGEAYYLDQGGSGLGKMLNEVGVPLEGTEGIVPVSLEVLPEKLNADTLIVLDYSYNQKESTVSKTDQLLANPLLAKIPAITKNRVLRLSTEETAAGYLMSALSIPTLLSGLDRLTAL